MRVKYQVFVSSTFEDLRVEREQVTKAVLEMGHIPMGMEMFSASDEEQWQLITRTIDEADYYVVILAHRYGSTVDGCSFTEMEYDYAKTSGTPCLGFILDDKAKWPTCDVDDAAVAINALKQFKAKVKMKLVNFWSNAEDLHGKVSIALMKQMNTNPQTGWVRASEDISPAVTAELTRLSTENATLRQQLGKALAQADEEEQGERQQILDTLQKNKVTPYFFYDDGADWEEGEEVTLQRMFSLLGPELLIEKETEASATYLAQMLNLTERTLRSNWPIPSNVTKTWIADLVTLTLVEPSPRKHQIKDTKEYWTLTQRGKEVLAQIHRARLDAGVEREPTPEEDGKPPQKKTAKAKKTKKA